MKNKFPLPPRFVLVAALTLAAAFSAGASTIFLDTFETDGGANDVNYQLTNRQSGVAAPVNWLFDSSVQPAQVQVNTYDAPGRLRLDCINGEGMYSGVLGATYLGHNFIESTNFAIEFDMTLASSAGSDWAALVFGATNAPISVNLSDGIGLLFNRNSNQIQLFNGTSGHVFTAAQAGFSGGFPFNYGTHVRIEVAMTGDYGAAGTTTIKLFLDGTQALLPGGAPTGEYVRSTTLAANNMTLMGYVPGAGAEFVDSYDNFQITDLSSPGEALKIAPAGGGSVTLSWPAIATGYNVQTNSVLTGGGWAVDPNLTPSVVGANNQVTTGPGQAAEFFRLAQ